jgi:hypothetical protein
MLDCPGEKHNGGVIIIRKNSMKNFSGSIKGFTRRPARKNFRKFFGRNYMTKGRPATTGVDDAVIIARKRGCVMRIVYGLETLSDLVIRTAAYVAFIKTRRTEKITATIQEIEHAYHNLIAELRLFPASAQILPELWIYSKHGTYRFFRISEAGLAEVDRDGMPVPLPGAITAPAVPGELPRVDEQIPYGNPEMEGRSPSPKGSPS